jgi:phosphate transport system protein
MPASFHDQLDDLVGTLVMMASTVTSAIRWASDALLDRDLAAASQTLEAAAAVHRQRLEVEDSVHLMLARHQPVASDLRLALTGMRVAAELDQMGALSQHVCKIMLLRHPGEAVPGPVTPPVRRMAETAERMAWKVARVLETRDVSAATQLEREDDVMDALERDLLDELIHRWPHGVQPAVDMALLARFYERYADHAVTASQQVVFLVTGARVAAGPTP